MKRIIQFKVYRREKYYVAECMDLPVVTQGRKRVNWNNYINTSAAS
ncbi:MAG: hypothetical protein PWQ58_190 [Archaeoglobaceae archaeon]|nr:hypothetical protein [Archaeoglobaceae archaeon]